MELEDLQDLLTEQLKDIYNAENQLLKALPRMAKKATNPQLKTAFESHLKETQGQVDRLEQVFKALGVPAKGKKCKAMEGLLEEGKEMMAEDATDAVMDAGLIAAAQRVEHYEIAAYGTVRTYAQELKKYDVVKLLEATLKEEKAADMKLTEVAETVVNLAAMKGE